MTTIHNKAPDPIVNENYLRNGDGSLGRVLVQRARIDVLVLDDWEMTPLNQTTRHNLLEVVDDRSTGKSTIITC